MGGTMSLRKPFYSEKLTRAVYLLWALCAFEAPGFKYLNTGLKYCGSPYSPTPSMDLDSTQGRGPEPSAQRLHGDDEILPQRR